MHTQTLGLVAMMLHPPSTPSSLLSSSWQHPLRVPAAVVFTLRTTPPTAACSPTCRWTVQPQTSPPPRPPLRRGWRRCASLPKASKLPLGFQRDSQTGRAPVSRPENARRVDGCEGEGRRGDGVSRQRCGRKGEPSAGCALLFLCSPPVKVSETCGCRLRAEPPSRAVRLSRTMFFQHSPWLSAGSFNLLTALNAD